MEEKYTIFQSKSLSITFFHLSDDSVSIKWLFWHNPFVHLYSYYFSISEMLTFQTVLHQSEQVIRRCYVCWISWSKKSFPFELRQWFLKIFPVCNLAVSWRIASSLLLVFSTTAHHLVCFSFIRFQKLFVFTNDTNKCKALAYDRVCFVLTLMLTVVLSPPKIPSVWNYYSWIIFPQQSELNRENLLFFN